MVLGQSYGGKDKQIEVPLREGFISSVSPAKKVPQ